MKNGWQTKKLGDLLEVQNGYAFSSKDYSESGHFVMRIGNVQNGYVSLSDPKFINLTANEKLQRFVLSEGDILVSLTGNVGRIGVIEAEVGFVEYLLQSFKARIQAMGKGSAQANINMGTFENERFPFPPVTEQKQIVAKLDSLREETEHLATLYECKLAALEALKKSLLHQAFTGQL